MGGREKEGEPKKNEGTRTGDMVRRKRAGGERSVRRLRAAGYTLRER